jgi:hypothetical protein
MSESDFGRPGRRADLARELHAAFASHGIDLRPGGARKLVDQRIAEVATQMRMSERSALRHFPGGWAEHIAAQAAVDYEAGKLAEQNACGEALTPTADTARLIMALGVTAQYELWKVMDECSPASVAGPLDAISALAAALTGSAGNISVAKSALLTTARFLGDEADAVRRGASIPPEASAVDRSVLAERLATDAAHARGAASA